MLRVDLARPLVNLVVKRKGILSRQQARIWNRDSSLMDSATSLLIEKYETETRSSLGEDEEDQDEESGLIRFLNWLIEHQDEIKAFIELIMSLFNNTEANDVL